MSGGAICTPIKLPEHQHFLTGRDNYLGEVKRPKQTDSLIMWCSVKHANIRKDDTSKAENAAGAVKILTGADWAADKVDVLPCGWETIRKNDVPVHEPPHSTG